MIRDEAAKLWQTMKDDKKVQITSEFSEDILKYLEKAMLIGCVMGKTEDFELVSPPDW